MARKKKQNKWLKAGIIGALVTGSVYYNVKKFVAGNKLRKAIFLTSTSAFILYNCHGDKLEKLGTKIYEGANSIINNPVRDKNEFLSNKLFEYGKVIDSLKEFNEYKIDYENKKEIIKNKINNNELSSEKIVSSSINMHSEINWYAVKKGETLSGISEKLTGNRNLYELIAEYNEIKNPSEVTVGFPLKIPDNISINKEFLNNKEYPKKFGTLKRGESLEDFVVTVYGMNKDSKSKFIEIKNYNYELGNIIPEQGYADLKEAIVYLR